MIAPLAWRGILKRQFKEQIVDVADVPTGSTAVIFGAAILRNGRLSTVLRDRMDTAINLYHEGQVERILVSGDRRSMFYDEPAAMKNYAVGSGVDPVDILIDPAGLRTYDTCYRARNVYGLDSLVLISQEFHLPRALYTCHSLGITAVGVAADSREYRAANWYEFREIYASIAALLDILRNKMPG